MKRIAAGLLLFFAFISFVACHPPGLDSNPDTIKDPHSFANFPEVKVVHLDWNAFVDFTQRKIKATATWTLSGQSEHLILDKNGLRILSVRDQDGNLLPFEEHDADSIRGGWIDIQMTKDVTQVSIDYETSDRAGALQWLEAPQTMGKRHPILFTQSQAILARTWIPCMDSPSIRFTYKATVRVPLGTIALMSASNPQKKSPDGTYTFEMKQPIPSYLMALAVGDFEFMEISDRAGVYAEPDMLESAAREFSDLEKMIAAAESLYGPYLWERYDLLVMPPSFPFGGMENPRLTFVTPTIIAGDKSLTSLVAHELAHSWSGNLVTNATWNDFWLNEGFTVYFELRIMEQLYGPEYAEMLAQLSFNELQQALNTLPENETILKADLKGKNPDDAVGPIAYEKGYFFLRTVERKVGRRYFDQFLRAYFDEHKFQSVTTEDFLSYLRKRLLKRKDWRELEIDRWIYEPGLPENVSKPLSTRFSVVESAVTALLTMKVLPVTKHWSAHEYIYFLQQLSGRANKEILARLDSAFQFTRSPNAEILFAWLRLCIEQDYTQATPVLENFLINTGRRKFVLPLYKQLIERGQKEMALQIFQKAGTNYHPITYSSVKKLFE